MSKRFSITSSTERFFGAESLVLSRSTSPRNPTVRSSARPSVSASYPSPASWPSSTASCRGGGRVRKRRCMGVQAVARAARPWIIRRTAGNRRGSFSHRAVRRQSLRPSCRSSGNALLNLDAHHAPVRYGYRRPGVWLVFPEVFHSEFCSGLDHKRVADVARGQRARGRR